MEEPAAPPVAIVGIGAVMPDAPDAATFWNNIKAGHYSIRDVPPGRWDPELYYDPDPAAPDKTYSKIGGWVTDFGWEPMKWKLPIPPKVSEHMDQGQRWSVACSRAALLDAGWPDWNVDPERVAVILGNAIGGEKHYETNCRIVFPEFARELRNAPSFAALPESIRESVVAETHKAYAALTPDITEDTMPGELSNVIAGRVCNLFNFRGPNFTTDAACASGLAAMNAAVDGLRRKAYDAVLTGGVDRNNGASSFVKFCKIGALSASGTRPFDAGADGFVMGEGAVIYALKRLEDAERDGDRIYALILAFGGSSDGKGKGITAPNPVGQKLAIERAWGEAGADPTGMGMIEAHGTSTRVGDANELESLMAAFGNLSLAPQSVALGSVKSNIGHLKAAAGVAGLFKAVMSLHEKVLPPSLHFNTPNPNHDWSTSPFAVNTQLREFPPGPTGARVAGVSAFGFGGTNFHAVMEEYVPGRSRSNGQRSFAGANIPQAGATAGTPATANPAGATAKAPMRGALVVGAANDGELATRLQSVVSSAASIADKSTTAPLRADLSAPVRVAIDYGDAAELADKAGKALKAVQSGQPAAWKMLRSRGVFLGRGAPLKTAFLYTGQGSQYVNMLKELRAVEPIVADTFDEADKIMTPLLGRPLSSYIFIDADDPEAVASLEKQLLQTEITQPAVLTTDAALTRLLDAYGIRP
ncbi:MAG: beta-ketoacyl synthase N-terminal-like domain-containing protein, partial [Frankiaceae bacterium]